MIRLLIAVVPSIDLSGIVAASMVIAGLGVLNDVTVTQARRCGSCGPSHPASRRGQLFASAMRIGRDHIASTIYTFVFAYVGASAKTMVLLLYVYDQPMLSMRDFEDIADGDLRTLCSGIGLVLAVPLTTVFAVWLAPKPSEDAVPPLETPPTPTPGRRRAVRSA